MTPAPLRVLSSSTCSLCAPAKLVVRRVAERHGLAVDVVEIDGDPLLEARYRSELPVVEIAGRKAFKYFVDEHELEQKLRARGLIAAAGG